MSVARAAWVAPLLIASACAGNSAPSAFLPSPQDAVQDLYGGWIELTEQSHSISGELLAAGADTLWVLPDTGRAIAVPTRSVTQGQLVRYSPGTGAVTAYTALGMLSTLSNGAFLVLTAPAWLITGIVAASSESHAPLRDVPPLAWADLAAYARFPQGLPAGIDLTEIRPKP